MTEHAPTTPASEAGWHEEPLRFKPFELLLTWVVSAVALLVAAGIVPGAHVNGFLGAVAAVAVIAVLNAVLPPLLAAIRLPLTLVLGFLLVLVLDALMLLAADDLTNGDLSVDGFWWALLVALVASAVTLALQVVLGVDDDTQYSYRVVRRIARRSGEPIRTDEPGIVFLEIDGLALPILRRAMRDGNAPHMARWVAEDGYRLTGWETDLSSQTGASQAGILLGSNVDIPAFRWVEKETATVMACSAPADCAELERRHATDKGLLLNGGASRGNLLSGQADVVILTVSRIEAEKKANPGYRTFFANGFNATRVLVLFGWEVILEWMAALRAIRRDVRPRGHRGGSYPFMRAAMCVVVRDLIVEAVLTDMMAGRPAIYATFSSYDEVAHHSGLERADTLEALRKLDHQFGRIVRADALRAAAVRDRRALGPRPDPGSDVQAAERARARRARASARSSRADVTSLTSGDENDRTVGNAFGEATGRGPKKEKRAKNDVSGEDVVVLASGNLGLVYLMDEPRRLTREEIDVRHPRLLPALAAHPHVGWLLVRSAEHGPVVLGCQRHPLPRERPRRGRRPARVVLAERAGAPAADRRLLQRRGHHGRLVLRPRPRRGLRVRGADLVPRRTRRAADRAVHPALLPACASRRADRRRRPGQRVAAGVARGPAARLADPRRSQPPR